MDRSEASDRGRVVAEDVIEHFGVKGMRWGVRKADKGSSRTKTDVTKRKAPNAQILARNGAKWVASMFGLSTAASIAAPTTSILTTSTVLTTSAAAPIVTTSIGGIAATPPGAALILAGAAAAGIYVTGRLGVTTVKQMRAVHDSKVKHSENDIIEHFGVKGMRWGVRRSRAERAAAANAPSEITVKTKAGKGIVKTSGGARHPVSDDAVRAAVAKQKLKASKISSLSNAELKVLNDRLNLENNYYKYIKTHKEVNEGKNFMKKWLLKEGESLLSKQPGPAEVKGKAIAGYAKTAQKIAVELRKKT